METQENPLHEKFKCEELKDEYEKAIKEHKYITDNVLDEIIGEAAKRFCEHYSCFLYHVAVTRFLPNTLPDGTEDIEILVSCCHGFQIYVNGYVSYRIEMQIRGVSISAPSTMCVVAGRDRVTVIGVMAPTLEKFIKEATEERHMLGTFLYDDYRYPIISRNIDPYLRKVVSNKTDLSAYYRQ